MKAKFELVNDRLTIGTPKECSLYSTANLNIHYNIVHIHGLDSDELRDLRNIIEYELSHTRKESEETRT